jgi:hypothetical protein
MILNRIKEVIINRVEIINQLLYAIAPISKFSSIFVQDNEEARFIKDMMGKMIDASRSIKNNLNVINRENL